MLYFCRVWAFVSAPIHFKLCYAKAGQLAQTTRWKFKLSLNKSAPLGTKLCNFMYFMEYDVKLCNFKHYDFSLFKPEDSGTYTCVANSAAGEDTHMVSLTVHVLPTFTELPGDVSLNKGEQLRLSCKATGIPLPKLTWTFNNNIIPGW